MSFGNRRHLPAQLLSGSVSAPSAAWCFLWGVSPHWAKLNQQPILSVAPVKESAGM